MHHLGKGNIMITNSNFNIILFITIILTIIQIILGTSVREHVDILSETGAPKILWLKNPTFTFYLHRTFSIVVLITNLYLFSRNRKLQLHFQKINWVIVLLFFEIVSGIVMYYLDFPFGTQTIHVVLATLLFGFQFYLILETKITPTNL
jgi:cytochrome c oxidase assembly protein subunit 15